MACVMKTACCGKSLLNVSHVLLYFNLIVDVLGLCYTSIRTSKYDAVYSYLLGDSLTSDGYVPAQLLHRVVEILIFFCAIISINKRKPSSPLLVVCVVFIILEMLFCIYALIELNYKHSFEEFSRTAVVSNHLWYQDQIDFFTQSLRLRKNSDTIVNRDELIRKLRIEYSNTLYSLDLVFALILVLKAYSTLVIYSCIVELKQITSNDLPRTQQHVHYNVERNNVYALPSTFNPAQFIQPLTHFHPYTGNVQSTHLHPNSQLQIYPQYPVQPYVNGVGSN